MQYDFTVVNDKLVCTKRDIPLTGNVNTYRCVFQIESDIENLYWFCVFEREGNAYVQPILNGECFIPREVLLSEGGIKIGCYGTNLNENDYKRVSTNWVYFNSLEGAYSEASVPEVPEPDLWEELVLKSVPSIGENGNWFIYDMSQGKYVDTGVKAEIGVVEEIDPTVPAWAKEPTKPPYTADEVGAYSKEEINGFNFVIRPDLDPVENRVVDIEEQLNDVYTKAEVDAAINNAIGVVLGGES